MKLHLSPLAIAVLLASPTLAADDPASKSPPTPSPANPITSRPVNQSPANQQSTQSTAPLSKDDLERKFAETLSNVQLVGHFTSNRDTAGAPLKEDKYTIESVTKVAGDMWLFKARIQYGGHDATVPLPLKVLWAGDTPVITVDQTPFPGLGSYSARVLIYDNKYVGTWEGANHGGTLFGKIVKAEAKDKENGSKDAK